jgi:hypothetical protein
MACTNDAGSLRLCVPKIRKQMCNRICAHSHGRSLVGSIGCRQQGDRASQAEPIYRAHHSVCGLKMFSDGKPGFSDKNRWDLSGCY